MSEKHYYYKSANGKGLMDLKHSLAKQKFNEKGEVVKEELPEGIVEITEEEYKSLLPKPKKLTKAEKNKQEIKKQIAVLKSQLSATDYKTLKFVDGALTEEEYAEVKELRASLRAQINELEAKL